VAAATHPAAVNINTLRNITISPAWAQEAATPPQHPLPAESTNQRATARHKVIKNRANTAYHPPTREQVDEAHSRLAMKHHPDRGGDTHEMARINAARNEAGDTRHGPKVHMAVITP
jgi:hypothetical protein